MQRTMHSGFIFFWLNQLCDSNRGLNYVSDEVLAMTEAEFALAARWAVNDFENMACAEDLSLAELKRRVCYCIAV